MSQGWCGLHAGTSMPDYDMSVTEPSSLYDSQSQQQKQQQPTASQSACEFFIAIMFAL